MTVQGVKTYSASTNPVVGDTGTGLDQLVEFIGKDTGLAGANIGTQIEGGADAANGLNGIIIEAIANTEVASRIAASGGVFYAYDVQLLNSWIRANRLAEWTALHGDDEGGEETGFHLVQGDGATTTYRGQNLVNTVADGVYHLGFQIVGETLVNEDGNANASIEQVANWLTQFYTDHSTTGTGLDRITNAIMADKGLANHIPEQQIEDGADAANGINQIIADAIAATGVGADGRIDADDVLAINAWIRTNRLAEFTALHGDDEGGTETGFHLIQGDGGSSVFFGQNLVNTVADGLYHIGFEVVDGRFVNEDGNANATVTDVAAWLDYFYGDHSTTGTGLDQIVDTIMLDRGLSKWTSAENINGGAAAADGLNQLIDDGLTANDATSDGWITIEDLMALNTWVKADPERYAQFLALHGDDEDGVETGFHLVQGDGGTVTYFGENLINTVADGIYHFGFDIENGRFLNEDGNENQTLSDVSAWLNYFYLGKTITYGTDNADVIDGTDAGEQLLGEGGDDVLNAGDGDDLLYGGWGDDILNGGAGTDLLYGDAGDDLLDGGEDADSYHVTGNMADGWESWQGFDTYMDSGTTGTDRIVAFGDNVDIGMTDFTEASGIEEIDATGATGEVRIVGDWQSNTLDFHATTLIGDIVIDAGYGDDTVIGSAEDNVIIGGGGDDQLDGWLGSDTYEVSGNEASGWESFQGFDTYDDTGDDGGWDVIVATGEDVDIGVTGFGSDNGIEEIDASGATGTTRLLGTWEANIIDVSGVVLSGNIVIDGGDGDDTIIGNDDANTIVGGGGDDSLDGAGGSDSYIVTGNEAEGWCSFSGYDTYADSGTSGTDTIVALGEDVDIGVTSFGPETGIEVIDATGATGLVRIAGTWEGNLLDFRNVTLSGHSLDTPYGVTLNSNIVLDGGDGDDTIYGNADANTILGGTGDDTLDGGNGGDLYVVTGNEAEGWCSFNGFDTYADSGTGGIDTILAIGEDVDIGFDGFSAANGIEVIDGGKATGTVRLLGTWEADTLDFRTVTLLGGNFEIDGGYGDDTIFGSGLADTIIGGGGNDKLNGGEGGDTYVVTGNVAGGWESFQDYDTYKDTGTTGIDTIKALGKNVDIGLVGFSAASGIEVIDATGATGTTRLLGDWQANTLDFRTTQLKGNIVIDAGYGNDTIYGSAGNDTIVAGGGNDWVNGGEGSDTYKVSGNVAGGWSSFQDYDTYKDTGLTGTDTIKAVGGNVDIGLTSFTAASTGIEVIDGTSATGTVRLLGDWQANVLDFRGVTFTGTNIVIDGGDGDDTIYGTAQANLIIGGAGKDRLDGGDGGDTYKVTGAFSSSFSGFDTYADTGTSGTDTIKAVGNNKVDIGFTSFGPSSGIEVIDASGATNQVRLLGDSTADVLNFSGVTFVGTNILIDAGAGADTVTGNAQGNVIDGGLGNDVLTGGLGADFFRFDTTLSKTDNVDRITDFSVVDDTLQLDDAVFKKLALGALKAADFVTGSKALDASDRIIYNSATGDIFYDADGSGAGAAVLFAKVAAGTALTSADFLII